MWRPSAMACGTPSPRCASMAYCKPRDLHPRRLEFAAGSLAMILGFVMCCLANGVGEPTKLVGGPPAADLDVELAIPAEYTRATTPKHWRRPDARAGTPPFYVSPIADVPPTEV